MVILMAVVSGKVMFTMTVFTATLSVTLQVILTDFPVYWGSGKSDTLVISGGLISRCGQISDVIPTKSGPVGPVPGLPLKLQVVPPSVDRKQLP